MVTGTLVADIPRIGKYEPFRDQDTVHGSVNQAITKDI